MSCKSTFPVNSDVDIECRQDHKMKNESVKNQYELDALDHLRGDKQCTHQ